MAVYEIENKNTIKKLYEGWQETPIWSCLQDCMGKAYADDLSEPKSAVVITGCFAFFAGQASAELVRSVSDGFVIMVPQNKNWNKSIDLVHENAVKRMRYATKKEADIFNKEKLENFAVNIPEGYQIKAINEILYNKILLLNWAQDLCVNFKDYNEYAKLGLGFVAIKDEEIVSGASSYTVYKQGIEIEIDTREDERCKGLALACGAKLILECLKRNIYPSWDAHNLASLTLAQKLGYSFDKEYEVFEVC